MISALTNYHCIEKRIVKSAINTVTITNKDVSRINNSNNYVMQECRVTDS